MPKRKKYSEPKTEKNQEKTATPENPTPDAPSKVHVNPHYDQMPDKIEDPAAVFRLAYLDMKQTAANNKLAFIAQDYQRKMQILEAQRNTELNNLKSEIRRIEDARRQQKEDIERTYNISLRSYVYDDITGSLTKQAIPDEEKEKPAKVEGKPDGHAAGADTEPTTLH